MVAVAVVTSTKTRDPSRLPLTLLSARNTSVLSSVGVETRSRGFSPRLELRSSSTLSTLAHQETDTLLFRELKSRSLRLKVNHYFY